jgi:hypothetical protein
MACSSTSDNGAPPPDAGGDADAQPTDAADSAVDTFTEEAAADALPDVAGDTAVTPDGDAGACTAIANSDPVMGTSVSGNSPNLGNVGTITPGYYVLQSFVDYAGTGTAGITSTFRRAMHLSSTRYETVRQDNSDPDTRTGGTWKADLSSFSVYQDCPVVKGGGGTDYFTDGTTLKVHIGGPPGYTFDRVIVMKRVGP